MVFLNYKGMPINIQVQKSLPMCYWISTYPFGSGVLYRSIKTGVTPHKSRVDNMARHGQFLPYHITVTDVSFKERSTCCMMCSFPLFSLNIIAQPRPDSLEKEKKAQNAFKERTLDQHTHFACHFHNTYFFKRQNSTSLAHSWHIFISPTAPSEPFSS